jgi:hypothetical protein
MHDMEIMKKKAIAESLESLIEMMMKLEGKKSSPIKEMMSEDEGSEDVSPEAETAEMEAKLGMGLDLGDEEGHDEEEKLDFFKRGKKLPIAKKSMTVVMAKKPEAAKMVSKLMKKGKSYG